MVFKRGTLPLFAAVTLAIAFGVACGGSNSSEGASPRATSEQDAVPTSTENSAPSSTATSENEDPEETSASDEETSPRDEDTGLADFAAVLDAAADACSSGDLWACEVLYNISESGSELEELAFFCGGADVPDENSCVFDTTEDSEARLAAYVNNCEEGDLFACDTLYEIAPLESAEELLGSTCGGTSTELYGECASNEMGGAVDLAAMRLACEDGQLAACDDLYAFSDVDSADEDFGSTCGRATKPTDGNCVIDRSPFQAEYLAIARTECAGQNWYACDWLYLFSDGGSNNELFGSTCGNTSEATEGSCGVLFAEL